MMLRLAAFAFALLSLAPAASAYHWEWETSQDGYVADSGCWWTSAECVVDYLCTGGAPPQVVDFVLHCVPRAASEAQDVVVWSPRLAWELTDDVAAVVEEQPRFLNPATQAQRDQVNDVLCDSVWSHFCANPLAFPDHVPIADPIGQYPL